MITEEMVEAAARVFENTVCGASVDLRPLMQIALEAAERVAWCEDMIKAPTGKSLLFKIQRDEPWNWYILAGFADDNGVLVIDGRVRAAYDYPVVAWRLMPFSSAWPNMPEPLR